MALVAPAQNRRHQGVIFSLHRIVGSDWATTDHVFMGCYETVTKRLNVFIETK